MSKYKPYLWKKGPTKRVLPKDDRLPYQEEKKPEEAIRPIQGIMPDSVEEFRLALSLEKFGVDFDFQVPIHGGKRVRGGQVLDFLAYIPYPKPIQVEAAHWHPALSAEEKWKLMVLRNIYQTEPIIVKSYMLSSQQDSDAYVVRNLL